MYIYKRRNRQLQDELALRRKAREDAERQKKDEASNKVCVCVFAHFYRTLSIDFKWFYLHLHVYLSLSYLLAIYPLFSVSVFSVSLPAIHFSIYLSNSRSSILLLSISFTRASKGTLNTSSTRNWPENPMKRTRWSK